MVGEFVGSDDASAPSAFAGLIGCTPPFRRSFEYSVQPRTQPNLTASMINKAQAIRPFGRTHTCFLSLRFKIDENRPSHSVPKLNASVYADSFLLASAKLQNGVNIVKAAGWCPSNISTSGCSDSLHEPSHINNFCVSSNTSAFVGAPTTLMLPKQSPVC